MSQRTKMAKGWWLVFLEARQFYTTYIMDYIALILDKLPKHTITVVFSVKE